MQPCDGFRSAFCTLVRADHDCVFCISICPSQGDIKIYSLSFVLLPGCILAPTLLPVVLPSPFNGLSLFSLGLAIPCVRLYLFLGCYFQSWVS